MATESMELFESKAAPSSGESYSTDGPVHLGTNGVEENKHLDLLNDFESYCEEINDRLSISRLVNDSVVKAVLEEAAEMVALKELQVTELKEQLLERQIVQQIQEELELILMQNAFHNVKEECEKRLPSSRFDGKRILCSDKLKQVSSICKDLEAVQKSLSNLEQLSTHGSLDSDYSHRRVANNYVLPSSSLWERNSSNEGSNVNLPENFDSSGLKYLLPVQLYSHLRDMIIKIKRDHETNVQSMIEDYFSLKREFLRERELLKERGYFLLHKSKDIDVLKKRIPEVILKLNGIAMENEDFFEVCDPSRDEYNNLLIENHHLRDMLNDKEREVKCLSLQVSEAEEKFTQKLSSEAHLSKQIEDLETSLDGAQIEASLSKEVYNCIIRDLAHQKCEEVENNMKAMILQETLELIYREALYDTEAKMSLEYGDFSNIQTLMAQEISGVIYQEVLKDREMQLSNIKEKYLEMDELVISLDSKASDMKNVLALEGEEKHNLEQKTLELETLLKEKAKLQITDKEQFDKELNKMMNHRETQDAMIFSKNNELKTLKVNLEKSLQQVNAYKNQVHKLTEALQKVELESQRAILQERETVSSLIDLKLTKTFEGFELKAAQSIKSNQLRLENSIFQLGSLTRKAKVLRTTGLWYKENLERRCSDLQKAEAEVDLLGDEVETLLGLLEKINIALDHYSPVLQHYPGIMEILRLIQRELNVVESTKSGSRTP